MSSSWNKKVVTIPNSLWRFRLLNQDPLRNHVPRGFMQKDENEGYDLFENLAEKPIQWEPINKNSRNSNSISSKGGLYSIESSITAEARIANLVRRLKDLETKEPVSVNQVSPNQIFNSRLYLLLSHKSCVWGVSSIQILTTIFWTDECILFEAQR